MAAAQHGSSTKHGTNIFGTDNNTKGKKVETTIHHARQPQLSVRVSVNESMNKEIEINDNTQYRKQSACNIEQ